MSLTYEHVLSNESLHEYYIIIVQKIVNKGVNVNAKDENGKMSFALTYMWKQLEWSCFNIKHGTQSLLYFLFYFIDQELYTFVWFLIILFMKVLRRCYREVFA
jgi:hypothetical protein